jgi:selenocysteine-specific elongation factor
MNEVRKHTIIGMAGHIDHGKTALIKALTGIQTDQHKEEQERGITIDIGFAYWQKDVTIIDVPGHEKFIRNMVAGVTALDLFLLVIAADDGIMPQTIEHMEILKFFGAKDGIVALNKIDLVDEEWQLLVEDDIHKFLKKYGFENISVLPVSASESTGINQLRTELQNKIDNIKKTVNNRPFRLNVDRSFSVKGFGSVVTGTILSSYISVGDSITILPQNKTVKVRGIQVHQSDTSPAFAGERAAVNIASIEKEKLPRGTVLSEINSFDPCHTFLAEIKTVSGLKSKIKRHNEVRIHIGTQEILGKIYWFENDPMLAEDRKYHVRLKLNQPGVAAPGDAVLIRSYSPVTTLAGGIVLYTDPPGIRQIEPDWHNIFESLASDDYLNRIEQIFKFGGFKSFTVQSVQKKLFENESFIVPLLDKLIKKKFLTEITFKNEKLYISRSAMDRAIEIIVNTLEKALKENQVIQGINYKQLANILKPYGMDAAFLERTLQKAVKSGVIIFKDSLYTTREASKGDEANIIRQQILDLYKQNRFNPPDIETVSGQLNLDIKTIRNLISRLSQKGELISVGGKFYLHHNVLDELVGFVKKYFRDNNRMDVSAMRDYTGCSRKFLIPMFEFLDSNGITERKDDYRIAGPAIGVKS